jgi:hypothetical protein
MSSYSQQHERRRRQRRSTTSAVATTAATAVVAYGSYRLAQWYWKEDDEFEEGTEHPLEEDLPFLFAEEEYAAGGDNRNRNGDNISSNHRPNNNNSGGDSGNGNGNSNNYSWLFTAAVGVASWLADAGTASPIPPGGFATGTRASSAARSRPQPTRRQQLMRCRCQSRVAFQTCFQTLKPALESLTDSSRQTKELKVLRRRRQALKQQQQQQSAQQENGGSDGDASTESIADEKKQQGRELRTLQEREEDLWREVLVETTTRMMVSSYAYALLLLSLTVQFHWLASTSTSTSEFHPNSSDEKQQEQQQQKQEALLMRSHRYFLNEGIPLLVTTVRRSVERVFFGDDDDEIDEEEETLGETQTTNDNVNNSSSSRRWRNPSSQFVSSEDIEQTLYHELPRVLDDIGMGGRQGRRRRRRRNWIRFVLPDEEDFDPLWDICRSPVWEDAQEQVLGYLWYTILRDGESNGNNPNNDGDNSRGWGKIFRTNGNIDGTTHSDDDGRKRHQKQQQEQQQLPLAKVMAHFKKAASALFEEESANNEDNGRTSCLRGETRSSTTVGRLQMLPTVLELGDITFQ